MRHHDPHLVAAPISDTALLDIELRILSGCHQGASLALAAGELLRVGSEGDCDVLLSDCGLEADAPLQVWWRDGCWFALSAQELASAQEDEAAAPKPRGLALGAVALLGQVHATVCAAHLEWTTIAAPAPVPMPQAAQAQEDEGEGQADSLPVDEMPPRAAAAAVPVPSARSAAALRRLRPLAAVGVLSLVLLGVGWAVWRQAPSSAQPDPVSAITFSPQAQEKAVKEVTLAIALADPALRMAVAPNAQGGVTVSGWVENAEQFDRLAQALSNLRPLPRLAVRTAQEVFDGLTDVGSGLGLSLRFAPMGAGKVQVRGLVITPEMQQQTLAQLRARAPEGIEIIDGLRVASLQGPEVLRWLGAQGLRATEARWDGEQLVLAVGVNPAQRAQLERLLATAQTPLSGVPFLLQTYVLQEPAAARRMSLAEARLPFGIRSVVGGAAPYVVLADGAKLQPGGARGGWRLAAIAPDHLVFDGPKRVEVSR
ncbi:type III secretion system inner membrane ring subunit SctD [Acidovorax sp. CCYZU-2555]|uniref:type III secretion system inner membrane ring subunit SctD n=1 Tax=Acidovorax sp. CCYZU-2555 TaxID=2835042 RepID=UPI001BCBFAE5|nr:type III secretion system inner membrane ring subunit SctD [Acidovorax sp. CCYZU-2555]MBS7777607.1 type III secretion system inner membrane ring subunit SctD [Acidovorax sp. CCYZU-2555]